MKNNSTNKYTSFEEVKTIINLKSDYILLDSYYKCDYSQFEKNALTYDLIVVDKQGYGPRPLKVFADDYVMFLIETKYNEIGDEIDQIVSNFSDELKKLNLSTYGDSYAKDLSLKLYDDCAQTYNAYNEYLNSIEEDKIVQEKLERDLEVEKVSQHMLKWVSYIQQNRSNGYKYRMSEEDTKELKIKTETRLL